MSGDQFGLREMAETARRAEEERDRAITRVEQAERERDEARTAHRVFQDEVETRISRIESKMSELEAREAALIAARERAEADNAILLAAADKAISLISSHRDGEAGQVLIDAAEGSRPGAALLEYVRALEAVREAVEPWRAAILKESHPDDVDAEDRALLDACSAADALKGKP